MVDSGLTALEAVLAIARHGSFRAAATELGLSTTALSNSIAKIERRLGVRLFNRTTRSVALSDAGRTFVEQIGPAMRTIREAMDGVRSQQATPTGTLRINAFATAARELLSPLILEYLRRYPEVHVDLVTEGRLVDIVADGFDIGVRSADLVPSDMIAVRLGPSRRHAIVATPRYFERAGIPRVPDDLAHHACLALASMLLIIGTDASAQVAGPSKLVLTWSQGGITTIDYPTQNRCRAAADAVQAEADQRLADSQRRAQERARQGIIQTGGPWVVYGFCIPG